MLDDYWTVVSGQSAAGSMSLLYNKCMLCMVVEFCLSKDRVLQLGFQDVAFLPYRASFYTTFIKHCGRGEGLWTTTCLKLWLGVSKGMLPVRYFRFNEASFCVSQISLRSLDYHEAGQSFVISG